MTNFWRDVRYAFRMVRKDWTITLVITVTLGLSIGMNASIFSVVNSLVLRPLPVKDARELMVIAISHPGGQSPHGLSYLDLQDFRKSASDFADMSGYAVGFAGLSDRGQADRITVSYITENYFDILAVRPLLGRLLLPAEGQIASADPIVVLGYRYWEHRFAGNPLIVGQTVKINGRTFTVIGITPKGFRGTYAMLDMDAYIPISMIGIESANSGATLVDRSSHRLTVLTRLKTGATLRQAKAQLQVIADQLEKQYPQTDVGLKMYVFPETLARPQPANALSNPPVAVIFMGLVSLLLFIACVNVANILLVRFTSRDKELAVRTALGASRGRLARQLLCEGFLTGLLGGVAGLLIGELGARILASVHLPVDLPIEFDFSFDLRVFSYVAAIVALTIILIGLVPALRSSRGDPGDLLRENRGTGTGVRQRLRNGLVAAQLAGAMVLIVTAGLFVRSLGALGAVNLGFQPDRILNLVMDPGQIGYSQPRATAFYQELEQRARSVAGVESASLAFGPPMSEYVAKGWVTYEGQSLQPNDKGLLVSYNIVGTDYFKTMTIPLLTGRVFTEFDSAQAPPVAIVNAALAEKLWPGQSPLGKRFSYKGPRGPFAEVVGLTATGKYETISEPPQPFFYVPTSQEYSSLRALQARTNVPPRQVVNSLEELIHGMEPELPVFDVNTMDDLLNGENGFFPFHIAAAITGLVGLLALLLGVLGVYGVVSFATRQRAHEIGIRLALGARRRDIAGLVLARGLRVIISGLVVGTLAMFGLSRLLSSLLFGIKANAPAIYTFVFAILLFVAIAACIRPALRATKIDPVDALRYE